MNLYEGLFILPQTLYREDKQRALEVVSSIVEKFEGTIAYLDLWEEKPLAYQIDHVRDVAYILCYYEAEGVSVQKIERAVILSDEILRCLIIRPDKSFDLEKFKVEAAERASKKASAPVEASESASEDTEEAKDETAETARDDQNKEETPAVEEVNA